ncbi:MAG: DUF4468 domain-containing protein [Bacteroidales bacterium]|nr:DUF4468 domain-containing protein [Bacteroidales bacterium]
MKKNILFLFVIFMPFLLSAQFEAESTSPNIPLDEEGKIRYKEVVKEEASQNDLFKRCVKWINKEYKSPNTVTKTRDMVNGKIVINHTFRIKNTLESGTSTNAGDVMYEMTIRFKENRYRVEMTNFFLKKTSRTPAEKWLDKSDAKYNPEYIKQLDEFSLALLESLKEAMKPAKVYKEEEW